MAMSITVTEDGPYVVRGGVPLLRAEIAVNEDGTPITGRSYVEISVSTEEEGALTIQIAKRGARRKEAAVPPQNVARAAAP